MELAVVMGTIEVTDLLTCSVPGLHGQMCRSGGKVDATVSKTVGG